MQIDSSTTIDELQSHFGELVYYDLRMRHLGGSISGRLTCNAITAMVDGASYTSVLAHLGLWVEVFKLSPDRDHSGLQTEGAPIQLHLFVRDRLCDLGVVKQKVRCTRVDIQGAHDYWVAVRRMLAFNLRFNASFDLKDDTGTLVCAHRTLDRQ